MRCILDVSRLLGSVRHRAPSGIDRVEMAYLRRFLAQPAAAAGFIAQSAPGWFGELPRPKVAALAAALAEAWQGGPGAEAALRKARRLAFGSHAGLLAGGGRIALRARLATGGPQALLMVSHGSLLRPEPIAAMRRAGAIFVPFIHDVIPLSHPEYTRPPQIARHRRRLATVAALADGIIVNSAATAAALRALPPGPRPLPPIAVASLGIEPRTAPEAAATPPYFVTLGTIEPRKNHLLLLNLWRELAQRLGPAAPRLLLLGRRGWENENILDMLERCTALRGLVEEPGPLPDNRVTPLLAGAAALLFPSFAEGYGLPLAEALGLGVPALCSDLPALREVGGAIPEFLDPLDGAAWRQAVLDYAGLGDGTDRRPAQLARLAGWRAPSWDGHFAAVEALLASLATLPAAGPTPARTRLPSLSGLSTA